VYQSARRNPTKFYIGIDANARPLERISERTFRKPEKGGAPNALFIQATVENLPSELDGLADEIHINFPWGSLLRAVALGDQTVLMNLRRLCASRAGLEIAFSLDPERDESEIRRLQIPLITESYIDCELTPRFREAGFEIRERSKCDLVNWPELPTSWAKKLRDGRDRSLQLIVAAAIEESSIDKQNLDLVHEKGLVTRHTTEGHCPK